MKKLLPLCTILLSSGMAFAAPSEVTPEVVEDIDLQAISNNGEWVVGGGSDVFSAYIKNLVTGKEWFYDAEYLGDTPLISYTLGQGRCVSNTGVVVGSWKERAAYWENGEWYNLSIPNRDAVNAAASITSDGKYIVGYAGREVGTIEDDYVSSTPVIWTRQADGSYSEPFFLPYPTTDITGRIPQYVVGISITDDGKTVGGFMRDYRGTSQQPVVFKCDDQGNWSYKTLGDDLLNPNHVEFPPYPGDFDEPAPNYEDYMSEKEINDWFAAHDRWVAQGEMGPEPAPQDFMSPEDRERYLAVYIPWYYRYIEWAEKYEKFEASLSDILTYGVDFVQNNVYVSPDGKYLVSTRIREEIIPGDFEPVINTHYAPTRFDLENGEVKLYSEDLNLLVSSFAADYSILANVYDPQRIAQRRGYIYVEGEDNPMPIEDFVNEHDPDTFYWMEDNMLHDVYTGIGPLGLIQEEVMCTGIPKATSDLSVIISSIGTENWVDMNVPAIYSYIFPTGMDVVIASVKGVDVADNAVVISRGNGEIQLVGQFKTLEIYNLAGMLVYSNDAPAGTIATGLSHGIYVVKALDAKGNLHTTKVVL